ncbi:MAG TPA: SAF domain-containing protein [Jiangellaceae bacterium]|nr:SAF domain-containing protein [Jiangellaceae bacterium]
MEGVSRGRLAQFAQAVLWHRRLLAAGLAAAALALAIHAAEADPVTTVPLVVTARELPGGATLQRSDLDTIDVLPASVPAGATDSIDAAVGRMLAGPARAGEPITDVRLVGTSLVQGWGDDLMAVPVRIADPGAVAIVRPGELVDLIAAPVDGHGAAGPIATQVPLLAAPAQTDGGLHADGALLVVAVTSEQAADLAEAAVTSRLSVAVR